ncbi:hypothetical protein DFH08DRAFT_1034772 [Mycena albidolilacea]|uniref:Uncharacterized protein n=1 Tax=Mycena albidolilacea TaxID=1033008 RepID=A0AAD7EFG0_9AGAR|nr:hypothetical protein DFH08DRAFT_1034772 [Mycena albidolilacea]
MSGLSSAPRATPRALFELAIHRIPTLALYRNLLRHAPDDNSRFVPPYDISFDNTSMQLVTQGIPNASEGDVKQRAIFTRYSRLIAAKVTSQAWQARLRSRPNLTGTLVTEPTLCNPPLPRMKPQPPAISQIILTRMRTRIRRVARAEQLDQDMHDLRREAAFEDDVARAAGGCFFQRVYSGDAQSEWPRAELEVLLARDIARPQMPVSSALAATLRAARREKVANKTQERRGEILRCTVRRARQGPPAHVLVRMTAAELRADQIIRGVGEAGYVGMVKRRMGVKLRDGGRALARENGTDLEGERLQRLKEMETEYWVEKNRRMRQKLDVQ